jgi:hypothetical protein
MDKDDYENEKLYSADVVKDSTDFYLLKKKRPFVYKYVVGIFPVLNGKFIDYSPILFEKGDTLDVKYVI